MFRECIRKTVSGAPKFQESSFSRIDCNSSVSSATSATSLKSPDNHKKPDTNR